MISKVVVSTVQDIAASRDLYRAEMNCQITHDSMCRRQGWALAYQLYLDGAEAGHALVAIGGPWEEQPTIIEYFVKEDMRTGAFDLFDELLTVSSAQAIEIQTNAVLLTVMLHTYCENIITEKIVFQDGRSTTLPSHGSALRRVTSLEDSLQAVEKRGGGSEWNLEYEGAVVASGGIMFHYNRPYGDIYMEVAEPFRRRGFGAYLVQELKRVCREELGSIPCARCNPDNVESRKTLQKAGFVPCANILVGSIIDR